MPSVAWWLAHRADINAVSEVTFHKDTAAVARSDMPSKGETHVGTVANEDASEPSSKKLSVLMKDGSQGRSDGISESQILPGVHDINGGSSCDDNDYSLTPLHVAVMYKHKDLVGYMILNGADPYSADSRGMSARDLARDIDPAIAELIGSLCEGFY
jgi:hypothetical protein